MIRISSLALVLLFSASCFAQPHPGAEDFASRAAEEYDLDPQAVLELIGEAEFKQSIVDAMTRPAEGKAWYDYRPIFMTDKRIQGGVEFWQENEELVARAAAEYGVDPQVIVSIIGVETFYGRIIGSYRVLDALATLSFHYPSTLRDRSEFFSGELMQFLKLGDEEGLPLREVKGSYAGAMGLGQFMPSSYREYAVDLDGDGRRDLWSSMADVIGSVANYLRRHGWQAGQPVTYPAERMDTADMERVARRNLKAETPVSELAAAGFKSTVPVPEDTLATVVSLEEKDGEQYHITFNNFYVITRYNRSTMYAMAVYELSEAIRAGFDR